MPVYNASDLDLEALMRSSPPCEEPGADDQPVGPREGSTGPGSGVGDPPASTSETLTPTHELTNASTLRGVLAGAQRRAERAKLAPYQKEELQSFIKSSSLDREINLFILLCAVQNRIGLLVTETPKYTVPDSLLENIKSYAFATLLSPKLSAYKKENVAQGHVYNALLKDRLHLPENIDRDTYTRGIIKTTIKNELTQLRSNIKKAVKASICETPEDSLSIYELASDVVDGTTSSITVPLCARLALMRKLFDTSGKYWDNVDRQLEVIREAAGGDKTKIARAFDRILLKDRQTYGDQSTCDIPEDASDAFSTVIDEVITN